MSRKVICLTPTKNEAWIIDLFLKAASTWADHIIVLDQRSEDGTRDIVRTYPKAALIDNDSDEYDEARYRRLLFDAARNFEGENVLVSLDADELLTGNVFSEPEWSEFLEAPPGTVAYARWQHILPGFQEVVPWRTDLRFAVVDNGSAVPATKKIHSPRFMMEGPHEERHFQRVAILHYPFCDPLRTRVKQYSYEIIEFLSGVESDPVNLFRKYQSRISVDEKRAVPIPDEWRRGYENRGVYLDDVREVNDTTKIELCLNAFAKHGTKKFAKLAIWDVPWEQWRHELEREDVPQVTDPRTSFDKLMHRFLEATRRVHHNPLIRLIQQLIRMMGWK